MNLEDAEDRRDIAQTILNGLTPISGAVRALGNNPIDPVTIVASIEGLIYQMRVYLDGVRNEAENRIAELDQPMVDDDAKFEAWRESRRLG